MKFGMWVGGRSGRRLGEKKEYHNTYFMKIHFESNKITNNEE